MRVTIGEIVNEMLPYCKKIETDTIGGNPFLKAYIGNPNGFCKGHIYVVQTASYLYSTMDSYADDLHERAVPSKVPGYHITTEKEWINNWLMKDSSEEVSPTIVKDLSRTEFLDHLYRRLHFYQVIKTAPEKLSTVFASLRFSSPKTIRTLESSFGYYHLHMGTIQDLINITNKSQREFPLGRLKVKDIREITARFRDMFLEPVIENNAIVRIKFDMFL